MFSTQVNKIFHHTKESVSIKIRTTLCFTLSLILLSSFFLGCSLQKTTKTVDQKKISAQTEKILNQAKVLTSQGNAIEGLKALAFLEDQSLNEVEKALKYNLKGVILFRVDEFEKSIRNLKIASKYVPQNTFLQSQIQLNIASNYYKLNRLNEMKGELDLINHKSLKESDLQKYARLLKAYGMKVQDARSIVISTLIILKNKKNMTQIQNDPSFYELRSSFLKLSDREKVRLFENFLNEPSMILAVLAQIEANDRYISGDKSGAKDMLSWLESQYSDSEEVLTFVKNFRFRLSNSSKIKPHNIGLILPLSGKRSKFGEKVLQGLDTGLKVLNISHDITLYTKDSEDSPAKGVQSVLELITEKNVAFIIGGLFPETAKAEYLEAKKYGVLFISLSPINLPKEEKNHHLIEIQGSIQSQVDTLFSPLILNKFGTKIGVIYPDNEAGQSYLDEIWRASQLKNIEIKSVASFPKNTHDFRETAKFFLGLKYPREREEELQILEDVYSHEKTVVRRIQYLPPVQDFDWIFIAGFPHEAIQLIPTLSYYDARKMKIIGGPSWISHTLVKEQKNLGTLYFVGEDLEDMNTKILSRFKSTFGKKPGLIELISLDAILLGSKIINSCSEVKGRDEFDQKLIKRGQLQGLSTNWNLQDGIWLKKMGPMVITGGKVRKL